MRGKKKKQTKQKTIVEMMTFRSVIAHAFAHFCNADLCCDFLRKNGSDANCTVSPIFLPVVSYDILEMLSVYLVFGI